MAQNFWIAICAWTACFVVTILVSLVTRPRPGERTARAWSMDSPRSPHDEGVSWYLRPAPVAIVVGVLAADSEYLVCLTCWILRIPTGCSSPLVGPDPGGAGRVLSPDTRARADGRQRQSVLRARACWPSAASCCCWRGVASRSAHDRAFRRAFGSSDGSARLPRARPGQPDRRAHRLQPRLRAARWRWTWPRTSRPRPRGDGKLRIYSEQQREMREWTVDGDCRSAAPAHTGRDYPIGVAQRVDRARAFRSTARTCCIRSTVPEGSGLSSSAALEVSSALALLRRPRDRPAGTGATVPARRARVRRHAVRHHGPVHLGLRAASTRPWRSIAAAWSIRLVRLPDGVDVRGGEHDGEARARRFGLPRAGRRNARRRWSASGSGSRRAELRDVSAEQFAEVEAAAAAGDRAARAARGHGERARERSWMPASAATCETMGQLMVDSHRSLQHDYEVSCEELDFLVDAALRDRRGIRVAHDRRRLRRLHGDDAAAGGGGALPGADHAGL